MSLLDWIILALTLTGIIAYGLYKSRTTKNLDGYFLSNRTMPWYLILLSIMGTQASAITFLSAPGQAYTDGMRFVQNYFGLPLAMVLLCITFLPMFHKLKIYTAYEYLENRFDLRTRTFTSFLFLLQRGLSTGISIYAPAIILSSLLGWNIYWTNVFMGGLLIIYTVTGGARAVAYTQQLQLIIIFTGMFLAAYMVVHLLPDGIGFIDALKVSGKLGKLNVITTGVTEKGFDWTDRYNIWSGIIGGFFLQLSYFGADQSQVGRYLTAKSLTESRLGLLMNGLVKVPMQFAILLIGILVFTFYQFKQAPVFFNEIVATKAKNADTSGVLNKLENVYKQKASEQTALAQQFIVTGDSSNVDNMRAGQHQIDSIRKAYRTQVKKVLPGADSNDTNYIFLRFVLDYLPHGLVGLLIAVIFLAAWGSIAAALNSLASCTVIDIHKKFIKKDCTEIVDYRTSRWYTFGWGVFSIIVAMFATNMGSLIEAVNVLGSLFYGVILGVFLVAFFVKAVKGQAVFYAAVIVELIIVLSFAWTPVATFIESHFFAIPAAISSLMNRLSSIGFLWLNAIGALGVLLLSIILQPFFKKKVLPSGE
jgi:solute:Na+ symporter, SSS family